MSDTVKYLLDEKDIPTHWYNIMADLPEPLAPPLHPGTGQPIGPEDLAPLFPMELIKQEVSADRDIEIPDEVRDIYKQWRPTPMFRARRLEKALEAFGLPTRVPDGIDAGAVVAAARHDKKARAGRARYALPLRLGRMPAACDLAIEIEESQLLEALAASRAPFPG